MTHFLRAQRRFLLAAGIFFGAAEARAGFDGWRGDFNSLYESSHPSSVYQSSDPSSSFQRKTSVPFTGLSGESDWQWHWIRSGTWIRIGIEGEFGASLSEEDAHHSWGLGAFRELNLGVPFGDSGSGSEIQIGVFPIRPGSEPDLFGNYVARYHPYPGIMRYPPRESDSLGATGDPDGAVRIAFGGAGDPLRSEFLALEEKSGLSFLGYLDGTLADGFDWGLGMGWRHALTWDKAGRSDAEKVWAKTDSGVLPIGYALDSGLAISESGGITAKGWTLSARLRWMRTNEALGRFGAFGEAALLGLENQPLFYEDRWRRVAATAGAYLPTAGLLQVCLIQMEWRPGAYHLSDAIRAHAAEQYVQPADRASAWSYAALLGRDLGRHWALRGTIAYAPQLWQDWFDQDDFDPAIEPVYPYLHRGKREIAFGLRAVFRFGARR